jgi:hypothetical protein
MTTKDQAAAKEGLKNCPLCGGKPYYTRSVNGDQMHHVGCASCGIDIKAAEIHYPGRTELSKDIVAVWNRRAPHDEALPRLGNELEFNEEVRWILGRPCFTVLPVVHYLRANGQNIPTKAEEEQAAAIFWMLGQYLEHGKGWNEKANAILKAHFEASKAEQPSRQHEAITTDC